MKNLIVLLPAAFDLHVFTQPTDIADEIQVVVQTPAELPSPPLATLTQYGSAAVSVPLVYDDNLSAYVGQISLNPNSVFSGVIIVQAIDAVGQSVEIASTFSLESVQPDQDITVWSSDGKAELFIPSGALNTWRAVEYRPPKIIHIHPRR